jgi:hypothetical protein
MTETLLLFAAGGAAGVLLAIWGSRAIVSIKSFSIPRMEEAAVNGPVAAIAFGAVLLAAVVVGVVIALQGTSAADSASTPLEPEARPKDAADDASNACLWRQK